MRLFRAVFKHCAKIGIHFSCLPPPLLKCHFFQDPFFFADFTALLTHFQKVLQIFTSLAISQQYVTSSFCTVQYMKTKSINNWNINLNYQLVKLWNIPKFKSTTMFSLVRKNLHENIQRERGFKHWCFLSIKAIKVIVHGYYVVLDLNHLPLKKKKGPDSWVSEKCV